MPNGDGDIDIRLYFCSQYSGTDSTLQTLWMRIGNQLHRSGILTMNQLCETPAEKIKEVRNIGKKSLAIILEERNKYIGEYK